jgi:hypothetical protein
VVSEERGILRGEGLGRAFFCKLEKFHKVVFPVSPTGNNNHWSKLGHALALDKGTRAISGNSTCQK